MANTERRGIGPTIDLQGFDLGMDMDTVDEPSRLPLLVVIALVVLAAFAGVVWLAYTQGVERGRASVSRELVAHELWTVHKSNVTPYTGLKIYETPSAAGQSATATTGPKRLAANAIPALRPSANAVPDNSVAPGTAGVSPASRSDKERAGETPAVPGKAESVPQAQKKVATRAPTELIKPGVTPPTHPITSLESPPPQVSSKPAAAQPVPLQQSPSKPASRPAQLSTNGGAAPPAPGHQVSSKPASAPLPASSKPAAAPASVQRTAAPAATPIAPPKPAPESVPNPAPTAMNGIVLQIGSYKSEAEARQSWNAFKSEHDAAAGYQPDVKAADLGAKGRWYRLRMGPFADKKAAQQVCARLKADGASCLLAQ